MKMSTKGRYGLRAMIDLAAHSGISHQTLSSIAARQNISEIYLEQVFSSLRKAGIVKSIKGAQGGYSVALPLKEIRVGMILRCLEGDLSIIDLQQLMNSQLGSISEHIHKSVWEQVNLHINQYVDSITLEDLVKEYEQKNFDHQEMYFI